MHRLSKSTIREDYAARSSLEDRVIIVRQTHHYYNRPSMTIQAPMAALHPCMALKLLKGSRRGNAIPSSMGEACDVRDEQEWEVEQIMASRISRGKLQYQAEWTGCEPDHTRYPAHGFKGAPYKIQDFHRAFPDQPGPPRRLAEWLASWEAGQELEDTANDDLPE